MGDFLHMDTNAVTELMGRLDGAGRDLAAGWGTDRDTIAGGEDFGGDAIAQAVRGAYLPAGDALRELAARLPAAVMADAEVGTRSAADYLAVNERVADLLRGVPGLGLGAGEGDARP